MRARLKTPVTHPSVYRVDVRYVTLKLAVWALDRKTENIYEGKQGILLTLSQIESYIWATRGERKMRGKKEKKKEHL